jgi:hypothetical protein
MSWRWAAQAAMIIGTLGCQASYSRQACNIAVNSFAAPYAEQPTTYIVLPMNQGVNAADPDFREYSALLERALDAHGYRQAASFEEAQLALFLGYGVGRPENHASSYIMPEWHQGSTSPLAAIPPSSPYSSIRIAASQSPRFSELDVSGDPAQSDGQPTYTRYAIINAVDAIEYRAEKRFIRVWSTKIVSVGHTEDLHAMFPVILAGAWDLLGVDSARIIHRQVAVNGSHVLWIKSVSATHP